MEPNVIIQAPEIKGPKFNFKSLWSSKVIFGVSALVLVIAVPLIYLVIFAKFDLNNLISKSLPVPKPAVKEFTVEDFKKSVVKDIKTTFATSKDAGVMAYIDLAGQEKNESQAYEYYVKAFNKMKEAYQNAKGNNGNISGTRSEKMEMKLSMIGLIAYASNLKYYKESDFVMPK
ncbi:hypothetical protein HYU95_05005 [Candidatus Daviesbacteria bacterium]|nr:hypothetical protein [Candidatus Daviesbacteria bacterium]